MSTVYFNDQTNCYHTAENDVVYAAGDSEILFQLQNDIGSGAVVVVPYTGPILSIDVLAMNKNLEITEAYEQRLKDGFISDALGTEYLYSGTQQSQTDLMGLVQLVNLSGATDATFPCFNDVPAFLPDQTHTAAQLTAVLVDGGTQKQIWNAHERSLRAQVEALRVANDADSINGLTINFVLMGDL